MDIYTGKAKVIIWTRSALFYPYNNLWSIIVDEEHDNSYVSDQAPRFHSLDIVNKISDLLNIPLLLASWTPSVTSMYKSVKWEYKQVSLLKKYKRN
jgi:primosomal protein N' (replication factor Y)